MNGTALSHIAFAAVVVMILLAVWAAVVLEAGASARAQAGGVKPGDESGEPDAPERKAA